MADEEQENILEDTGISDMQLELIIPETLVSYSSPTQDDVTLDRAKAIYASSNPEELKRSLDFEHAFRTAQVGVMEAYKAKLFSEAEKTSSESAVLQADAEATRVTTSERKFIAPGKKLGFYVAQLIGLLLCGIAAWLAFNSIKTGNIEVVIKSVWSILLLASVGSALIRPDVTSDFATKIIDSFKSDK